jgi:hypothetical protein
VQHLFGAGGWLQALDHVVRRDHADRPYIRDQPLQHLLLRHGAGSDPLLQHPASPTLAGILRRIAGKGPALWRRHPAAPGQQPENGGGQRLAGPALIDNAEDLAGLGLKVDVPQGEFAVRPLAPKPVSECAMSRPGACALLTALTRLRRALSCRARISRLRFKGGTVPFGRRFRGGRLHARSSNANLLRLDAGEPHSITPQCELPLQIRTKRRRPHVQRH